MEHDSPTEEEHHDRVDTAILERERARPER